MRIVAGEFRGRRLAAVRGADVRPTSDRVREAVFSILGNIDGNVVLDLFAGTGAMGLEALSRGATAATFVEIDRQAHEVVRRNIDATVTDDSRRTALIKGDAERVVRSLALAGERFDLVFFDPPYDHTEQLLDSTRGSLPTICTAGSRVVLELATRHKNLVEEAALAWGAEVVLKRAYGDTSIAILELDGQPMLDPSADVDPDDYDDDSRD
ncbi:MAG: 16S rRNA (guanine(966)-N(2))-methyltransferase RsmD [Thermoleophilia bacterium]|nr:16S rRNA (guanine(966)-N(2))-methyltransferase RsmD [Thermoleophilia bacterium]